MATTNNNNTVAQMKLMLEEFITYTAKKLVDNPDEVEVIIVTSTKSIIVQIRVKKEDFGKVIGKKGRTIECLKTIALAIKNTHFSRDTRRVSLELIEDEPHMREPASESE
jgi:predicted RNA-binding protein YlqC (UPF0109 family)